MGVNGVHPSKMALDQMGHGIGPIVARIQAGHEVEVLSTMFLKNLHVFLTDFHGGLQAIGDKGWRKDQHFLDARFGALFDDFVAEGREPFFVQPALEGHAVSVFRDAQALGQGGVAAR